jgi:hypothetical protein
MFTSISVDLVSYFAIQSCTVKSYGITDSVFAPKSWHLLNSQSTLYRNLRITGLLADRTQLTNLFIVATITLQRCLSIVCLNRQYRCSLVWMNLTCERFLGQLFCTDRTIALKIDILTANITFCSWIIPQVTFNLINNIRYMYCTIHTYKPVWYINQFNM